MSETDIKGLIAFAIIALPFIIICWGFWNDTDAQ
jgi:hypothetical protein